MENEIKTNEIEVNETEAYEAGVETNESTSETNPIAVVAVVGAVIAGAILIGKAAKAIYVHCDSNIDAWCKKRLTKRGLKVYKDEPEVDVDTENVDEYESNETEE